MKQAIEKAAILVGAARYIKKFKGKIVVIKYGGNVSANGELNESVFQDISMLSQLGMKIVVVHGGGPKIDEEMRKRSLEKKVIDGLRVTDAATIKIVARVLNDINQQCVLSLQKTGVKAEDCTTTMFETKINNPRLGYVGDIVKVNTDLLLQKIKEGVIPVVSCLGTDMANQVTNINADTAATKIAIALKAEKLTILTNVNGVIDSTKRLIRHISVQDVEQYIQVGTIHGGMIPKVRACAEAASHGVKKAHLINGTVKRALLLELFTDTGIGTEIVNEYR